MTTSMAAADSGTGDPGAATLCPLIDRLDTARAGQKAAVLSILLRHGFPVPPGVVVTADALDAARASGSPEPDESLVEALCRAVAPWGGVPLAVRSSGVDEDLADASFAGLYATVLNVRGIQGLRNAIRVVWQSATSERVASYRADGAPAARMAVLVQPMVDAVSAGVAFTADPVTGDREVTVVEAVRGAGELLVGGGVTPDRWEVRGDDATRRRGGGDVLSADQAVSVADWARRVTALLGGPHDTEWALSADGVTILQARPITALPDEPGAPVPVDCTPPPGYWERESVHVPMPWMPFSRQHWAMRNEHLKQMLAATPCLIDGMELRDIGGWEYVRIVPMGGRERTSGRQPPAWVTKLAFAVVPQLRRRVGEIRKAYTEGRPDRIVDEWLGCWRGEIQQKVAALREVDVDAMRGAELAAHLRRARTVLNRAHGIHFLLHGPIAFAMAEFAFTCRDLLGWSDAESMQLLAGLSPRSSEPGRALAAVAELHGTPGFADAFDEYLRVYGCRGLTYEVAEPNLEERPDLVIGLIHDLRRRGFNLDPTTAELQRRRAAAVADAHARLADPAQRAAFDTALNRAVRTYGVREDNVFLTICSPLGLYRRAALAAGRDLAERGVIRERDDVFFLEFDEVLDLLENPGTTATAVPTIRRRKGERAWVLAHPGPSSYGSKPPEPSLDAVPAVARRAVRTLLWAARTNAGDPLATASSTSGVLTGIASSAGRYTGVARVVMGETEYGRVQLGDVLVCPTTSPVWSVVFPRIGALVTDHGGILSHPAIIAREFAIPAVTDTACATTAVRDGQLVTVDGDAGVVRVLS